VQVCQAYPRPSLTTGVPDHVELIGRIQSEDSEHEAQHRRAISLIILGNAVVGLQALNHLYVCELLLLSLFAGGSAYLFRL
jgi:hypothetical protein